MKETFNQYLRRSWPFILILTVVVIAFCAPVLFTDKIIRASDVLTQLFWSVKSLREKSFFDILSALPDVFRADWYLENDGGRTAEGGWNTTNLLLLRILILKYFPFPSSIGWLAVLSLLWGGIGTFFYCRVIGVSRVGSLAAGLIFSLCTENLSLINAGHIQKIETLVWMPWILLCLEKAITGGRFFHYALTALLLAIQFFTLHWQISFYTCLTVGLYWIFHFGWQIRHGEEPLPKARRDILLATVMVTLFFTTIAMSFAPLFSWSKQSERGSGMSQQEGMSWSMPPEEVLTYVIPGLVGYSRQEAGDVTTEGNVYYWGRMHITQTSDYLGLLPLLLLPLPLIFRKDRHTWFMTTLMAVTLIMALGRYTFVYQMMFDYLPGFSTFRVPKMILFLFSFGAAVLAGRGMDLLMEADLQDKRYRRWVMGLMGGCVLLGLAWIALGTEGGRTAVFSFFAGFIANPTRYETGEGLAIARYVYLVRETGIAFLWSIAYVAVIFVGLRKWIPGKMAAFLLLGLLLGDLWRVDSKFMVVTDAPQADRKAAKNEIVTFLEPRIGVYRMQPLNGDDAFYYSDYKIPNLSAYVTISEKRYREFLDSFNLMSAMPDIMNLKYLIMTADDFQGQKDALSAKYSPVFVSGNSVVLENRTVLPKAWLVPAVALMDDVSQRLATLSNPSFNPAAGALVESPPPLSLAPYTGKPGDGRAELVKYKPNEIIVKTSSQNNALLVLGEKYYKGWKVQLDDNSTDVHPVNHILRGVYVPAGEHMVTFRFDPLPFKIGRFLTVGSFVVYAIIFGREILCRRRNGWCSGKV